MSFRQGIDMDGDKQIGLIVVGNLRTTVELYELVGLAGIDYLHVRAVLLHQFSEGKGEFQREVFLTCLGHTNSSGISSTVSGINHQRKSLVLGISRCHTEKKQYQDE